MLATSKVAGLLCKSLNEHYENGKVADPTAAKWRRKGEAYLPSKLDVKNFSPHADIVVVKCGLPQFAAGTATEYTHTHCNSTCEGAVLRENRLHA